jgi:hypothetical protein
MDDDTDDLMILIILMFDLSLSTVNFAGTEWDTTGYMINNMKCIYGQMMFVFIITRQYYPTKKKVMITIGTGNSYRSLMLFRGEPLICLGSLGFLEKLPVSFNHGPNLRVLEP